MTLVIWQQLFLKETAIKIRGNKQLMKFQLFLTRETSKCNSLSIHTVLELLERLIPLLITLQRGSPTQRKSNIFNTA